MEEPRLNLAPAGLLAGLSYRQRREVDPQHVVAPPGEKECEFARATARIEYRSPDQTGVGEGDERPLGAADVPVRDARVGGVVDVDERATRWRWDVPGGHTRLWGRRRVERWCRGTGWFGPADRCDHGVYSDTCVTGSQMAIEPIHARYPFTAAARGAVDEAGVDLAAVVASDETVVARGLERVEWALTEGEVGEPHRRTRVELLSYPVARVLVSLVDERILTRKYAQAEAATAYDRFTEEFEATAEYKSTRTERLSRDDLLGEFDLTAAVREGPDEHWIDVGAYLRLAADQWGDEWRLVNRRLADGEVAVTEAELHELLRQAIRHRIADGLPLSVPQPIAAELDEAVAQVRETLSNLDLTREIDTVVPELFPPCMKQLLDRVQKGEHLEHHSRFAIASFLTSIGMTTDEIVDLFQVNPGFGEEATRYQVDHIRGATSPTEYSPPSCATMQSYGDCYNKDDVCEDVIDESHPLNYYEHMLDEEDEDDLVDWREQNDEDGDAESGA